MIKRILLPIFLLFSLNLFGQIPGLNDRVRVNASSPAKTADALDGMNVFTASGTNTYAITPNLGIYASSWTYTAGDKFHVTFLNTNSSTTVTLNVNGEGAVPVKDSEGNDLPVSTLKVGAEYDFYHNGTHFRMVGASGGGGGGGSVESVDGNIVDNTDPANPIILTPTLTEVLTENTDAGNLQINNLADPTLDDDADTKGARNAAIGALSFVEGVTGDGVDNFDPENPVLAFPIASEVISTPSGGISSSDVQSAIEELDDAIAQEVIDRDAAISVAVSGLSWKNVRVTTTVAGTLATSFENGDAIDGVTLVTGDRILVKNQASAIDNGIRVVAASGTPARATDADTNAELQNAAVLVAEGSTGTGTAWVQTQSAINIGSTSIIFQQLGSSTPNADASTRGIAKLYTSTGSNTDGSMDQNSITNTLALKLTASSNLSDLANAGTARTNLGGTTVGQAIYTATNPSAVRYLRINADNTVTLRTAAEIVSDMGSVTQVITNGVTTTSPSEDAVFDALAALSLVDQYTPSTGDIKFDIPRSYGFNGSAVTGNITIDVTGALDSTMPKLLHADGSEPTITVTGGGVTLYKSGGNYFSSESNIYKFVVHKNNAGTVTMLEYTISPNLN